jgi:serine/threonine protein kinase
MPPELFTQKNVGASPGLDVWSLGCILYALVVGKIPFRGETVADIKNKIVNEKYTFPSDLKLSDEVRDLLSRMLEKEPEKRASIYEISDHAWVNKRAFTDEERVKIKERAEVASILQAQAEMVKEDESPPKKVPVAVPAKKNSSPNPDKTRGSMFGGSSPQNSGQNSVVKKGKDAIFQLKEVEKEEKTIQGRGSVVKKH